MFTPVLSLHNSVLPAKYCEDQPFLISSENNADLLLITPAVLPSGKAGTLTLSSRIKWPENLDSAFVWVFGSHSVVFRDYTWFCAQGSLSVELRNHLKCLGSYSDWLYARQVCYVSYYLLLCSLEFRFSNLQSRSQIFPS